MRTEFAFPFTAILTCSSESCAELIYTLQCKSKPPLPVTELFLHVPYNDAIDLTSIASNPQHVCLVNDNYFSCLKERNISAFPGEHVTIKVRVVGLLNGSLPGIVHVESSENLQLLTRADIPFYNASLCGELNVTVAANLNDSSTSRHNLSLYIGVGNSFVIFTEYSSEV